MLTKKRVLLAKLEAAVGVRETLTAADGAMNIFDATLQPEPKYTERQGQGMVARRRGVLDTLVGRCKFTVDVHGSNTPATPLSAWASTFLPACNLVKDASGWWKPSSLQPGTDTSHPRTVTIELYEDGEKKCIYGAMGTAVLTFAAGKVVRAAFDFIGLWGGKPVAAALPTPTYPDVSPIRTEDGLAAIGSFEPNFETLTLDLGNKVTMREGGATGYRSAIVGDWTPTIKINPEATLPADNDLYGQLSDRTEQAFSMTLNEQDALAIYCTAEDAGSATVQVTATEITLIITGGANAGTMHCLFSGYATLTLMQAYIAGLTGWACTLSGTAAWPTTGLNTVGPLACLLAANAKTLVTHGTGNAMAVSAPKVQVKAATQGDRNGLQVDDVELECHGTAGDDEIAIRIS